MAQFLSRPWVTLPQVRVSWFASNGQGQYATGRKQLHPCAGIPCYQSDKLQVLLRPVMHRILPQDPSLYCPLLWV